MNASKNISLAILIFVLLASFVSTAELSKQPPVQVVFPPDSTIIDLNYVTAHPDDDSTVQDIEHLLILRECTYEVDTQDFFSGQIAEKSVWWAVFPSVDRGNQNVFPVELIVETEQSVTPHSNYPADVEDLPGKKRLHWTANEKRVPSHFGFFGSTIQEIVTGVEIRRECIPLGNGRARIKIIVRAQTPLLIRIWGLKRRVNIEPESIQPQTYRLSDNGVLFFDYGKNSEGLGSESECSFVVSGLNEGELFYPMTNALHRVHMRQGCSFSPMNQVRGSIWEFDFTLKSERCFRIAMLKKWVHKLYELKALTVKSSQLVGGNELTKEQIGETVKALFQQLHMVETEKRALAEKRWNEMSKEQRGRYIVSMAEQEGHVYASRMSKEEAEAKIDEAKATMTPEQWRETISSVNHLKNDDRRIFREKERQFIENIAALGKPAVPLLVKRMTAPVGSRSRAVWMERQRAIDGLTKIGGVAVPELMLAARERNIGAVIVLGRIRAKDATELLVECLTDKDQGMRAAAAEALAAIGNARAMNPLLAALKDVYHVRRWAVEGLARFGDSSCIAALEELARTDPGRGKIDIQPRIWKAIEAIKNRQKAEKAGQHFNHVIENDPNSDIAFWDKVNLAHSYITTNQGPKAQDLIDELFVVSDGDKTKAEGARILAEDYLYIWKKREANRLFRYFVENDPNNPDARDALAQVAYTYLAIKDYNAAEAAGKQFIGKYSDHNDTPKFVHTLASGFRKREQFEKALPLLDYVISNYPDDPHCEKAWMEKATIGLDSANDVIVEQVINKFKKELPENPFIAEPFRIFADQFAWRYDAQQAQELYQYIIDHSQDTEQVLECRMGQAMILIDANDQTAFDALVADLNSHPEGGKLFYALAVKCEWFEHFEHAEAAYRSIIEVDPNCDAAAIFQRIGWTLVVRGLYNQAITEYRKTVEEYPNSKWASSCQYWIGQSYYKKRDYEQARVEYQKVVDKYPDDRYATYSRTKIATIERKWKRTGPSKQ